MNGVAITGNSTFSHFTASDNARVHAGHVFNIKKIYQAQPTLQDVLNAFGHNIRFLLVYDFSSSVVRVVKNISTQRGTLQEHGSQIEELVQLLAWLKTARGTVEDGSDTAYSGHTLSERTYECKQESESLFRGLRGLHRLKLQNDFDARIELENWWEPLELHILQKGRFIWQRSHDTLQGTLDRLRDSANAANTELAKHLVWLFWSKDVSEDALQGEQQCIALVRNAAELLKEDRQRRVNYILSLLDFDQMYERRQRLPDAHPQTFKWVLRDDQVGLKNWLLSGRNIYWITGKAASGKSVLVKFLCAQLETKTLLNRWSGGTGVILLSFYFWFGGISLQNSREGLIRSILHQLISEKPALAKVAFPALFGSSNVLKPPMWTESQLLSAFSAIRHHQIDVNAERLCIFIDGLDEYADNQGEMVALLSDLAERDDVKLCVASRPWTAFRSAYEDKIPSFRLEQYSKGDIRRFVSDNIYHFNTYHRSSSSSRPCGHYSQDNQAHSPEDKVEETEALIDLIQRKADGVFLWVHLVVRSVLEGLTAKDSCEILRARVETYPKDLNRYFRTMLSRVDDVYKDQKSQHLKLAMIYTEDDEAQSISSWLDFWLISVNWKGMQIESAYEPLKSNNVRDMQEELRNNLNASCKDLLFLPKSEAPKAGIQSLALRVTWLHRTVYDFLTQNDTIDEINRSVPAYFENKNVLQYAWLLRCQRFYWYGPDAQARVDQLLKIAFSRQHTIPHDRYAAVFDRALLTLRTQPGLHSNTIGNPAGFRDEAGLVALAKLVAFGKTDYTHHFLDSLVRSGRTLETLQAFSGPILIAMIGEDSSRKFGISQIDEALCDTILNMSGILDEKLYDSRCNRTMRQVFWRKWAREAPNLSMGGAAHAWNIAKLVLQRTSGLDDRYCTARVDTPKHDHVYTTLRDILGANLSKQQLSESKKIAGDKRRLRERFKITRKGKE